MADPSPSGSDRSGHDEIFVGRGRIYTLENESWEDGGKVEAKVLYSNASGKYKIWVRKTKVVPTELSLYHPISADDSVVR
jgi:hypothetical protein